MNILGVNAFANSPFVDQLLLCFFESEITIEPFNFVMQNHAKWLEYKQLFLLLCPSAFSLFW